MRGHISLNLAPHGQLGHLQVNYSRGEHSLSGLALQGLSSLLEASQG